jgi:hypothetical protein
LPVASCHMMSRDTKRHENHCLCKQTFRPLHLWLIRNETKLKCSKTKRNQKVCCKNLKKDLQAAKQTQTDR